jgi:hypothetical protein
VTLPMYHPLVSVVCLRAGESHAARG